MDSPQKDKIPAMGRDPVNTEGGRGTDSNPQNNSHEPAQGQEKGRAKERKQHHVVNSVDLTEAVSTPGASRGSNKKKSRDSEATDTGHKSTGPLPQAMADVDSTPTGMEGLHPHDRVTTTPGFLDKIPTSQASIPILTDILHPPTRQEDSTDSLHQAGIEMDRSLTNHEGLCPHEREGNTPECPSTGQTSEDLERFLPKKKPSPPRPTDRIGTEPSSYPTLDHSLTLKNQDGQGQLPGPIVYEPECLTLDPNSASTGFAEPTCTASSESNMQREAQLSVKHAIHATDNPTLLRDSDNTALPEALNPRQQKRWITSQNQP